MGVPSLETDPADADWTSEIAIGGEDSSMATGKRRDRLMAWLQDDLPQRFESRLVAVDHAVAEAWGTAAARAHAAGFDVVEIHGAHGGASLAPSVHWRTMTPAALQRIGM